MVNELPAFASAIATCFAAVSTYKVWQISKQTFEFQKAVVNNKKINQQIYVLMDKFDKLKSICPPHNMLDMNDEDFRNSEELIEQIHSDNNSITNLLGYEIKIPYLNQIKNIEDVYKALEMNSSYFENVIKKLTYEQRKILNNN